MSTLGPSGSNSHALNFPQGGLRRNPGFPPPHATQQNKQSPAPHNASPYQPQAYPPQQQPPQAAYHHQLFNQPQVNGNVPNGTSRTPNSHVHQALGVGRQQRAAPPRQQMPQPQTQPNPTPMLFPGSMSQSVQHDSIMAHQQHQPQQHQGHPSHQPLSGHQSHHQPHPQHQAVSGHQSHQSHPAHPVHPSHQAHPGHQAHPSHSQQQQQQQQQQQSSQPHSQPQPPHHQQRQQPSHPHQPPQQLQPPPPQQQQHHHAQHQHPQQPHASHQHRQQPQPHHQQHQQPPPPPTQPQQQPQQQTPQQQHPQPPSQQQQQPPQPHIPQPQVQAQPPPQPKASRAHHTPQQQQQPSKPPQPPPPQPESISQQEAQSVDEMDVDNSRDDENEVNGLDAKMLSDSYVPTHPLGEMMSPPPEGGSYPTLEAVQKAVLRYCTSVGYAIVIGRSKKTVPGLKKVLFVCDRAGKPPNRVSPEFRKRKTSSRKCDCPFGFFAIEQRTQWTIRYRPDPTHLQHNHGPSEGPSHHPAARKLDSKMVAAVKELKESGAGVTETLQILQSENPDCHLLPRDIYNARAAINRNPQKVATGIAENRPSIYTKPPQTAEDRIRSDLRRELSKARDDMKKMEEEKQKEIDALKAKVEEQDTMIKKFEMFIDICNQRVMVQRERLSGPDGQPTIGPTSGG